LSPDRGSFEQNWVMSVRLSLRYKKENLEKVFEQLEKEYYSFLFELCAQVDLHVEAVLQKNLPEELVGYIRGCRGLVSSFSREIVFRREVLGSYVSGLVQKQLKNHDCSRCTGVCAINHESSLIALLNSHRKTFGILDDLHRLAIPVQPDHIDLLGFKILLNEMMILGTSIYELFYIEENVLIPKIREAQTRIGARSGME
jgi:hypothetical protein